MKKKKVRATEGAVWQDTTRDEAHMCSFSLDLLLPYRGKKHFNVAVTVHCLHCAHLNEMNCIIRELVDLQADTTMLCRIQMF